MRRITALLWTLASINVCGIAQHLPEPAGQFAIGRVTLLSEDSSRIEPLEWNAANRRIMFDVWYPAERTSSNEPAQYLDLNAFERGLGVERLNQQLGGAYAHIKAGQVMTHATKKAPFARSLRRAPLLLFSPGGGMIRELYTSQMENLASHGYIVAAVTHTYDGFLTVLPDGSSIPHDGKRWPRIPSFEGEANLNQLEWHTNDLLAVLNYLISLNRSPSPALPFAGHIDATRIGAFGHSFGGVAAAHACQKDQRIKACVNQDGAMGMKPFYLDAKGWGMDQPFLLIERPPNREPLTEKDLAEMKLTRARATEFIEQLNAGRDRVLRKTGKGSYRVLLQRTMTTHMDFSDLPLLAASNAEERDHRSHILSVINSYTLAFIDRYVREGKKPFLPMHATDPFIESVEKFNPAERPR